MRPLFVFFLAFGLLGILNSCNTAQPVAQASDGGKGSKNYPLRVSFQADYVTIIPSRGVAIWGMDNSSQPRSGRMNTRGQGYMTLRDHLVNADLPYYGQRDLFRDVYEQPDIILKDKTLQNVKYVRSADHKIVALEFDVYQNTERFHVQLVIMRDKNAYLLLQSPHRQSIRYEGRVEVL